MQLFPLCLLIILRMGYLLSIWEEMLVLSDPVQSW